MILCIDIGNTDICLGLKQEDDYKVLRFKNLKSAAKDYFYKEIKKFSIGELIDGCVISCVVPKLHNLFTEIIQELFRVSPLFIHPLMKASFKNEIKEPTSLGADLFSTSEAAVKLFGPGVLVVDMGTATKLTVVDQNYQFLGGAFCAGMKKSLATLFDSADLLEEFNVDNANVVVGRTTAECIESGYIFGNASMIDGMITRIKKELNTDLTIVLTGGLSKKVKPYLNHETHFIPNLIFIGMESLYEQNK